MKVSGTLETKFYHIIPLLLSVSFSRITNGKNVDEVDKYETCGRVYSLHITPFLSFGFVLPKFIK